MPNRTIKAGVVQKLSNGDFGSFGASYETTITFDFEELPDAAQLLALSRQMYGDARRFVAEELERQKVEFLAARPAPVETAAQRDQRALEHAGSTNGNGRANGDGYHHNGDREIDRARQREEPAAVGGYAKQPVDYGSRNSGAPSGGQYRAGGGGKSYGPPKSGGGLIAWAKELEEKGEAKGLSKWIMYQWGKRHGLGDTRVVDWPEQAVRDCYDEARARQENGN